MIKLCRVLTDRGSEYCGGQEHEWWRDLEVLVVADQIPFNTSSAARNAERMPFDAHRRPGAPEPAAVYACINAYYSVYDGDYRAKFFIWQGK